MSGQASDAQIGGLLVGLAAKGSTVEELVGASTVMREKSIPVGCDQSAEVILDTCGTGGDVRGTFNISTVAALIVAATGVKVVKHGNRSASGRAGSADVLEKLGVKIEVDPPVLQHCLKKANMRLRKVNSTTIVNSRIQAARAGLQITQPEMESHMRS